MREKLMALETYELKPISNSDRGTWLFEANKAGHPETPPPGTTAVILEAIRPDLVRRSVYETCDGTAFYILDRGGLLDQWLWFGPISLHQ